MLLVDFIISTRKFWSQIMNNFFKGLITFVVVFCISLAIGLGCVGGCDNKCSKCNGTGRLQYQGWRYCDDCGGSGKK